MEKQNCPQCKEISTLPTNRIVRDSCGHLKCRICLLREDDGCISCRKNENTKNMLNLEISTSECGRTLNIIEQGETFEEYEAPIGGINNNESCQISLEEEGNTLATEVLIENIEYLDTPLRVNKKSCLAKTKFSTNRTRNGSKRLPSNVYIVSSNPNVYHCTSCDKKFRARSQIAYHAYCTGKSKPYSCTLCQKGFVTKSFYDYHIQVHSGKKPYICGVCGTSFYQRSKLKRHLVLHTGVKSHQCEICKAAFNNPVSLRKHCLIHSGIKPHKCKTCGKLFRDSSNLRKHEASHTNVIMYSCAECGKQYKMKWSLMAHAKSHHETKPYSCDYCQRTFYAKKDQMRHELIHSGEKKYRCTLCNTKFRRKDNLDRHIRNTHPGVDFSGATEKLTKSNDALNVTIEEEICIEKKSTMSFVQNDGPIEVSDRCKVGQSDAVVSVAENTKKCESTLLEKDKPTTKDEKDDSVAIIEANNRRQSVIFSPVTSRPLVLLNEAEVKTSANGTTSIKVTPQNTEKSKIFNETVDKKLDVGLCKNILTCTDTVDNTIAENDSGTDYYVHYIHKKVNYEKNRELTKRGYHREQFNRQSACPPDLSKLESYKNPEPVCTPESIELYKKILMTSYKGN